MAPAWVYAAQLREGTETRVETHGLLLSAAGWFMQLNPARGRKLLGDHDPLDGDLARFMQLQPREGTETPA